MSEKISTHVNNFQHQNKHYIYNIKISQMNCILEQPHVTFTCDTSSSENNYGKNDMFLLVSNFYMNMFQLLMYCTYVNVNILFLHCTDIQISMYKRYT